MEGKRSHIIKDGKNQKKQNFPDSLIFNVKTFRKKRVNHPQLCKLVVLLMH